MLVIDKADVRISGALPIVPAGEKASRSFQLPDNFAGDVFISLRSPDLDALDLPDGASFGVTLISTADRRNPHGGGSGTQGLLQVAGAGGAGARAQSVRAHLRPKEKYVRLVLNRTGIVRYLGDVRYEVSFERRVKYADE